MDPTIVKILNRIAEVENRVLKGLVLDEHGAWVPIADRTAVEEEFISHLSAGQILHEGRWMSIAEAQAAQRSSAAATTIIDIQIAGGKTDTNTAPGPDQSTTTDEAADFPPETTRMPTISAIMVEDETTIGPLPPEWAALASGFPPETKAIMIEPRKQDTARKKTEPKSATDPAPSPEEPAVFQITAGDGELPAIPPERQSPEAMAIAIESRKQDAAREKTGPKSSTDPAPSPEEPAVFQITVGDGELPAIPPERQSPEATAVLPPCERDGTNVDQRMQAIFLSPEISSWEQETERRKKRTIVTGLIIVTLAVLGAALIIAYAIVC